MRHFISILFAVCSVLFVFGCSHHPASVQNAALDGLTETQLVMRFGTAQRHEEYPMSQAVGEFRTGLQRHFPMPQNRDTLIRELTWDFSDYHITAWLHQTNSQWLVFESLRYKKGVQF